jgi:hypothetical protein
MRCALLVTLLRNLNQALAGFAQLIGKLQQQQLLLLLLIVALGLLLLLLLVWLLLLVYVQYALPQLPCY